MNKLDLNLKEVHNELVEFLRENFKKAGFSKAVLGLSGGIDSALVAYLLRDALGKENALAIMMPYKSSNPDSLNHAKLVVEDLKINSKTIEITDMIDAYFKNEKEATSLRMGNKMARERMSILFDYSSKENALVVGTSNKTEIYLGYSTQFGDSACAFNPIGDLYKTNVWELSRYLNIPKELIKEYKIMERKSAIKNIHYPVSMKEIEEAKRRFAIEELLILELGILKNRFIIENSNSKNYEVEGKKEKVREFLSQLTFNLTNAQKKVIKEIYDEISNGKIVNRLIQGDVGSGKTVVAMVMLIYMAENGYQGALMAPTEILANQHYLGIKERLEKIGLRVELLTSSIKGKKKNEILEDIANGDVDIVIGTHSLIEDDVIFKKLRLIVIDEQHRFGVNQRNKLREKGFLGNLLVMSATPIPRSLALSIYGDLDLSIIDELPPGRTPIKTKWIANDKDLEKMYNFIYKKVNDGNQAYFVAPLIETSDKMALKSVDKVSEEIERKFSNKKIGIIHGKMKAKEKDEVMLKFKNKEYDILIATTVIEVGIDVPASTIMTIYNAERFGLSALHQLRGRVGRGSKQSYCFLISNSTTENSKQRLSIMEETEDGFRIAEEDLKLRNSGEIFGLRQSGFSDLKFIDIIYDVKTIKLVRDECIKYLKEHKGEIENIYLKYDIEQKFSDIQAGN